MDQSLLSSLLQKLVIDNERVCLPGMGSFVAEEIPSVFLDGGKSITPPGRRVLFRSSLTLNDGRLETAYAAARGMTLPQAREILLEEIAGLRGELEEKEQAELPGFGMFRKKEAGQYFFVTDKNFVAAPDSYGLETLILKIKTESAATEGGNPDIKNVSKKNEAGTACRPAGQLCTEREDIPEKDSVMSGVPVPGQKGAAKEETEDGPAGSSDSEVVRETVTGAGIETVGNYGYDDPGRSVRKLPDIPEKNAFSDETAPADSASAPPMPAGEGKPDKENPVRKPEGTPEPVSKQAGTAEKVTRPVGMRKESKNVKNTPPAGEKRKISRIWTAVLWMIGFLAVAALLIYIFRDSLRPLLEKILYSREELEILHRSGRL